MAGREPLREVGYWAPAGELKNSADRPNPRDCAVPGWATTSAGRQLAGYLRAGYVESYEMGYSNCRFSGCGDCRCPAGPWVEMGCVALTDGSFVWPEGLAHYVEAHSVQPPDAAGAALLARATSADGQDFTAQRQTVFTDAVAGAAAAVLEWDEQSGAALPMAKGMAEVVAAQSRLIGSRTVQTGRGGDNDGRMLRLLGLTAILSLLAAVWLALDGWPEA